MFIYEKNKARNIEHLFQINNKNDFWKAFYSYKNNDNDVKISDNEANHLIEHFKKLYFIQALTLQ